MLWESLLSVLWACSCLGVPLHPERLRMEPNQAMMKAEKPRVSHDEMHMKADQVKSGQMSMMQKAIKVEQDRMPLLPKEVAVEQAVKPRIEVNLPMLINSKNADPARVPMMPRDIRVEPNQKPVLEERSKFGIGQMPQMSKVGLDRMLPENHHAQPNQPAMKAAAGKDGQDRKPMKPEAPKVELAMMAKGAQKDQKQMKMSKEVHIDPVQKLMMPNGIQVDQNQMQLMPKGVQLDQNQMLMMPKGVHMDQNQMPPRAAIIHDPNQIRMMSEILPQQQLPIVPEKVQVEPERLVIIMLDGFRWDYEDRFQELPAFAEFRNEGVRAKYVQPIFPSISFPSWTTIATGLYPESHGVVGNYMYDPDSKMVFSLDWVGGVEDTTNDTRWWQQHIPIWASATAEGIPTSMYLWSRCDVPFQIKGRSILPQKCIPYNNDDCLSLQKFSKNLYDGVQDLKSGTELLMIYYGNIDEQGHIFGPDSGQVIDEIIQVNWALESFLDQLLQSGLLKRTNIILVSDHGMTSIKDKRFRKITDFTDPSNLERVVERNAFAMVQVTDGADADVVARQIAEWRDVDVYTKSEIPEQFHLKHNDLVLDLLLVPKGDTLIRQDARFPDMHIPIATPNQNQHPGAHGFDGTGAIGSSPSEYVEGPNPNMRGIFYAMGPAFKRGQMHDWIKLVDEYQIFTHVLGIQGESHNGTWERVRDMFDE